MRDETGEGHKICLKTWGKTMALPPDVSYYEGEFI